MHYPLCDGGTLEAWLLYRLTNNADRGRRNGPAESAGARAGVNSNVNQAAFPGAALRRRASKPIKPKPASSMA